MVVYIHKKSCQKVKYVRKVSMAEFFVNDLENAINPFNLNQQKREIIGFYLYRAPCINSFQSSVSCVNLRDEQRILGG